MPISQTHICPCSYTYLYTFGSGTGFRHSEKDPVCRARESGHSTRMCGQANQNPNKQWPVIDADSESLAVVSRHRNVHGEWPDACSFFFFFFFCSALGCRCGVFVLIPASTAVRRVKDRGQRAPPPPLRTLSSHISFQLYADFCWAFMWLGRIAAAEGWRSLLSLVWFVRWFLAEEANEASDLIFRLWWVSFCPIEQRMRGVRGWGHPV